MRSIRFAFFLLPLVVTGLLLSMAPPSGRPPVNALRRYEPEKYELSYEVVLSTIIPIGDATERGLFNVKDAPIVMPVIYQGAYSKVFPGSEWSQVLLDGEPARNIVRATDENKPFHTHHLRMVIPKFRGQSVRWQLKYTMQSWSAAIDERKAQQAKWPRDMEWPDEVADALRPQQYIESDHEVFQTVIKSQGGENLRNISPYLAAKQIVAYTLNNFQINGTGTRRGGGGIILGMNVEGALAASTVNAVQGRATGTEHDLVCLCVAMLRAASIPARPVVGVREDRQDGRAEYVSWAEFYLPDSGWVSFDPVAMKKNGPGRYRNVESQWPEFGSMEELNERVPLSYHFHPPGGLQTPGWPAVWGWDPRTRQPSYEQTISIGITGRGKGEEDPG